MAISTYDEQSREMINGIYDAQKQNTLAGLESAYQQNLSNAEAAKGQIGQAYQTQRNDLATVYERTRKNTNEAAAASGLNVGTGSQAQLMQRSEYQRDNANLNAGEANALTAADRNINDITAQYANAVAAANSDNDYKKGVALMQQWQQERDRDAQNAQILAGYGDFSGYAKLYGEDAANNMRQVWVSNNPDTAYNIGSISAEEYRGITGKYPAGYTPPSAGGYYYGGNPKGGDNTESTLKPADVSRLVLAGYSVPAITQYVTYHGGTHDDIQNAIKWATQMGAQTSSGNGINYSLK